MFFASPNQRHRKIPDRLELRKTSIPGYLYVITFNAFMFPLSILLLCRHSLHPLKKLSVSDLFLNDVSFFFSTDIDECLDNSHNCHLSANCTNNAGSFSCSCLIGYTGDGISCSGTWYMCIPGVIYSWNLYHLHVHLSNGLHFFFGILFAVRKYFSCKDYGLTTRKNLLFWLWILCRYVIFYDFSLVSPFFCYTYTSHFNGMATIWLYIETIAFLANRPPESYASPTLV